MSDRKHRIVITTDRPGRRQLVVVVAMVAVLVAGFAVYRYTRATTASEFEKARSERDQLMQERREQAQIVRRLRSENADLRDRVAYLSRSQEIDTTACSAVKQSLTQLQAESSDLREQLAFYRGIVSPEEAQIGVRVYDFKVYPQQAAGTFHYELVLIQSARNDHPVQGRVDLRIEGLKGQAKQTLDFADVGVNAGKNLLFSFRYFQELDGSLRLPRDFRPLHVTVAVNVDDAGKAVQSDYEWQKIEQERGP